MSSFFSRLQSPASKPRGDILLEQPTPPTSRPPTGVRQDPPATPLAELIADAHHPTPATTARGRSFLAGLKSPSPPTARDESMPPPPLPSAARQPSGNSFLARLGSPSPSAARAPLAALPPPLAVFAQPPAETSESDEQPRAVSDTTVRPPTKRRRDDDGTQRRSRTVIETAPPSATVRHVTLTPVGRRAPVAAAGEALTHEAAVFGLNAYDEQTHGVGQSGSERAMSNSTQTAATFVNYLVAHTKAGGPPIQQIDGGGYSSTFIAHMLSAPPERSMPASQSAVAGLRLNAQVIDYQHFRRLCATPEAGMPGCCRGQDCESLNIRNKHGERINSTPWVAHWFASERASIDENPEAVLAKRMCIQCENMFGLRMFIQSASTNTAVNVTHDVHAAVGWFVLVNQDGEFCDNETIGPSASCFNGLIGNIPHLAMLGWSLAPSSQPGRAQHFIPPYKQYCPQTIETVAARGF